MIMMKITIRDWTIIIFVFFAGLAYIAKAEAVVPEKNIQTIYEKVTN
jgi:hypothetical protein